MSSNPTRWSVPTNLALRWRQWGDHYVVFNTASGDTHLLNSTAALVLKVLEARPSTGEELLAEISRLNDAPLGDALSRDVDGLLEELDELGLVSPARS